MDEGEEMSKKTQQLFQAIHIAYNDPEMAKHPEIRQQLLEVAKDLNRDVPYQMVALKLRWTISRYVLLNHLQSPAALSQLYTTIGQLVIVILGKQRSLVSCLDKTTC